MDFYYLCLISDGVYVYFDVSKYPLQALAKRQKSTSLYLEMTYNLRFDDKKSATTSKVQLEQRFKSMLQPDGSYNVTSRDVIASLRVPPDQRYDIENTCPLYDDTKRKKIRGATTSNKVRPTLLSVDPPIEGFNLPALMATWDREEPGGTHSVLSFFSECILEVENREIRERLNQSNQTQAEPKVPFIHEHKCPANYANIPIIYNSDENSDHQSWVLRVADGNRSKSKAYLSDIKVDFCPFCGSRLTPDIS